MAVQKPTQVQECGAWLMQTVVRTLANAVPVEIGKTKAVALTEADVNRIKKEAQVWAQVLGMNVPEPVEVVEANEVVPTKPPVAELKGAKKVEAVSAFPPDPK